jgi:CRP-like cAMP-binding protein
VYRLVLARPLRGSTSQWFLWFAGMFFGEDCLMGFHRRPYTVTVASEVLEAYQIRRHQAARPLIKLKGLFK